MIFGSKRHKWDLGRSMFSPPNRISLTQLKSIEAANNIFSDYSVETNNTEFEQLLFVVAITYRNLYNDRAHTSVPGRSLLLSNSMLRDIYGEGYR